MGLNAKCVEVTLTLVRVDGQMADPPLHNKFGRGVVKANSVIGTFDNDCQNPLFAWLENDTGLGYPKNPDIV